jgi:hypothetical protein
MQIPDVAVDRPTRDPAAEIHLVEPAAPPIQLFFDVLA